MRPSRTLAVTISVAALLAVSIAGVGLSRTVAQDAITVEPLTSRSVFPDQISGQFRMKLSGHGTHVINMRDVSRTLVARITVQPGAMFPWHTHPGPVIVNVAQGELVVVHAMDCVVRPYPAGATFLDPGHGNVHTAFNRTGEETVVYATFLQVPAEGPLTITEGVSQQHCPDVGP